MGKGQAIHTDFLALMHEKGAACQPGYCAQCHIAACMTLLLLGWFLVVLAACLSILGILLGVASVVVVGAVLLWKFVGALACFTVYVDPSILVLVPFSYPRCWRLWTAAVRLLLVPLLLAAVFGLILVLGPAVA